jgi:hypothetical protein
MNIQNRRKLQKKITIMIIIIVKKILKKILLQAPRAWLDAHPLRLWAPGAWASKSWSATWR